MLTVTITKCKRYQIFLIVYIAYTTFLFRFPAGRTEDSRAPELIPECCACGSAKYTLTFEGIWSRQSHPKDYPTRKFDE